MNRTLKFYSRKKKAPVNVAAMKAALRKVADVFKPFFEIKDLDIALRRLNAAKNNPNLHPFHRETWKRAGELSPFAAHVMMELPNPIGRGRQPVSDYVDAAREITMLVVKGVKPSEARQAVRRRLATKLNRTDAYIDRRIGEELKSAKAKLAKTVT